MCVYSWDPVPAKLRGDRPQCARAKKKPGKCPATHLPAVCLRPCWSGDPMMHRAGHWLWKREWVAPGSQLWTWFCYWCPIIKLSVCAPWPKQTWAGIAVKKESSWLELVNPEACELMPWKTQLPSGLWEVPDHIGQNHKTTQVRGQSLC